MKCVHALRTRAGYESKGPKCLSPEPLCPKTDHDDPLPKGTTRDDCHVMIHHVIAVIDRVRRIVFFVSSSLLCLCVERVGACVRTCIVVSTIPYGAFVGFECIVSRISWCVRTYSHDVAVFVCHAHAAKFSLNRCACTCVFLCDGMMRDVCARTRATAPPN